MKKDVALKRYLERHIEPGLPDAPDRGGRWQNVLVVPAYDESPELLDTFSRLTGSDPTLIILVLNRPDSDPDTQINSALRNAVKSLPSCIEDVKNGIAVHHLCNSVELFCHDLEQLNGPGPAAQGVGLARKVGCDIALLWQSQGAISSEWICCTDADARLPSNYFSRLEQCNKATAAAVYPFAHIPGDSDEINRATALYELRLHHYVLGLQYAESPYAYHTLGSCIAVRCLRYAQVRGYPKRSGGEDFYLLNKLAKLAPVVSLDGECISLQSRASQRVPFGTGPATEQIISEGAGNDSVLFYHPHCFEALRAFLAVAGRFKIIPLQNLSQFLVEEGLSSALGKAAENTLLTMGLEAAIKHCREHGKSTGQFLRQFHQWFDGFRTLKFIHAIRDKGWPMQNLQGLGKLQPQLFPTAIEAPLDIESIRASIRDEWHWTIDNSYTL